MDEGDQRRYAPIDIQRLRAENARLQERLEATETQLERDREGLWEAGREAERTVAQQECDSLQAAMNTLLHERDALQAKVKEADEVMGLAVVAFKERVREVALLKRERDNYKVLAERRKEALMEFLDAVPPNPDRVDEDGVKVFGLSMDELDINHARAAIEQVGI